MSNRRLLREIAKEISEEKAEAKEREPNDGILRIRPTWLPWH